MAKLYFKYGTMGSSKTANALMTRFNYIQQGIDVLLLKPALDTRDGKGILSSRIGLSAPVIMVYETDSLLEIYKKHKKPVIIVDEAQFLTAAQVDELRIISDAEDIPVFCYGLRTDFQTKLFEGSKRLFELADSIEELKSVCSCGKKAIVNARFENGKVTINGNQICIGGDEKYKALCYQCWRKALKIAGYSELSAM